MAHLTHQKLRLLVIVHCVQAKIPPPPLSKLTICYARIMSLHNQSHTIVQSLIYSPSYKIELSNVLI
jgi:hypothetical protein